MDTNNFRAFQFPWNIGHHIDGISTTNTNAQSTQTTAIWRMRVGADHQQAGETVVLENDLMDNARTWFPGKYLEKIKVSQRWFID